MDSSLVNVVVDSRDPVRLAHWWRQALDWRLGYADAHETDVVPSEGEPGVELVFVPVPAVGPDQKVGPNRVHLDLDSSSPADQRETVEFLLDLGARHVDVGQGDVPWVVLADPEDNEFCVLDPRPEYDRTGKVAAIVCLAADPVAQARFWSPVAGMVVVHASPEAAGLRSGDGPFLEFVASPTPHTVKNRVHLDVRATASGPGRQHVVTRALETGARHVDVGQGDATWTVLADPEGNEFCVLGGTTTG